MRNNILLGAFVLSSFVLAKSGLNYDIKIKEKNILNEVTTIQALPQREKATLDIEVLKVKTETINGIIYEDEKKVIFDFKDLKKSAEKKRILTDSRDYEIFILENLDNAATYMKNKEKFKMNKVFEQGIKLRNGEKIKLKNITYGLVDKDREKVLEVVYNVKPDPFYLGVLNNKTGMIEKIYKTEFIQNPTKLSSGSISDFSYSISNSSDIIIEYNYLGEYISNPMTIRFEQNSNSSSNLFPVIALGNESVWKKENHNGGLPVEGSMESIEVGINNALITGKIKPQLKYKTSNPSGNIGQSKKIYYHNILGDNSNKIAIGAYETSGNEFVEVELTLKIDEETIGLMKQYAFNSDNNGEELVEIPYENLNQISFVVGSSEGNGYYDLPAKDIASNSFKISYPKIYVRRKIDDFSSNFDYNISGLKDHIIEESNIGESGNYIASLGTLYVYRKLEGKVVGVPAMGIGSQEEWSGSGGEINSIQGVRFNFNSTPIKPYLIPKMTAPSSMRLLTKSIKETIPEESSSKIANIALVSNGNSAERSPNVIAELKIAIPNSLLKDIKAYADLQNEDIVEIPYFGDYKVTLIPSSKINNHSAKIPDTELGVTREILYPKILYKKNSGNQTDKDSFTYDYKLNSFEIGEDELIETNDLDKSSGFLHFKQTERENSDNKIPMIALGKNASISEGGYLFNQNSSSIARDIYIAKYNGMNTYPYLKDLKGGALDSRSETYRGTQQSSENSNLGFWIYSQDTREEVYGTLALKIKKEDKLNFLNYARTINSKEVELKTAENVAFVHGVYSNGYDFSDSSKVTEVAYPPLTIFKDVIVNSNIEIDFNSSYTKGEKVSFDLAGNPSNSSVTVNLNSGQFMNGLKLNDGTLEIFIGDKKITSKNLSSLNETIAEIQESNLNISLIYKPDGLASMVLNNWIGNSHTLKIVHREKSGLIRREYMVILKTPAPTFEVISKDDLDFGTVLKGDNTRIAQSKIVIKNLSGSEVSLTPITNNGIVELKNGSSVVKVGNFSVTNEVKDITNENSYFILEGQLVETDKSTLEGEHTGQFYLNINLK
ncbi:hypothetical protein [Cetobacterium sp.]|uniref:hypothetical protein n=1 Tax=Cetobacterium sp. TaxID=2071632 RepID=UPI003F416413